MSFQDRDKNPVLVTLDDQGAVPVGGPSEVRVEDHLLLIYRELRESRRLYCEMNGLVFEEFPV